MSRLAYVLGCGLVFVLAGCGGKNPTGVLMGEVLAVDVGPGNATPRIDMSARKVRVRKVGSHGGWKRLPVQGDGSFETKLQPGQYVVDHEPYGLDVGINTPTTIAVAPMETTRVYITVSLGIK